MTLVYGPEVAFYRSSGNFRSKINFVLDRYYENKYHKNVIITNISVRRM